MELPMRSTTQETTRKMNTTLITIGNADKGGFWFAVEDDDFQDGFRTASEAAQAAMAKYPLYEIYYEV